MDNSGLADAVLLVARLLLGLGMAAHGAQKLFGWFGGHGLRGTAGFLTGLGFRPAPFFALLAALGETGGGVLTALGFLGPVGPALIVAAMIVAAVSVHLQHGFFAASNGFEVPALYIGGALVLLAVGPGRYSLDAVTGLSTVWTPARDAIVLAVTVAGAVLSLLVRGSAAAAAPAAPAAR
jgi:putative oxidoreductase